MDGMAIPGLNGDKPTVFEIEAGVWAVIGKIRDYTHKLQAHELAFIDRAVAKRRFEYATGRYFARLALEFLGNPPGGVLQGRSRRPLWPDGIVGSISHSNELAFVIVSRRDAPFRGIGVDVEKQGRVSKDLEKLVLTSREIGRCEGNPLDAATLTFSAKEAVFKAVNPLAGLMIGFNEVEIHLDTNSRSFHAEYVGANIKNEIINTGTGVYAHYAEHVVSRFVITHGS